MTNAPHSCMEATSSCSCSPSFSACRAASGLIPRSITNSYSSSIPVTVSTGDNFPRYTTIASHCQHRCMLIMADTLTFGFSARSLCLVKLQHVWRAHDVYLLAGYFDIRNSINSLLPLAYAISSQPWMVCILIGESFRHHCSCSITNVYHSGASYWPVGIRSSFAISSLVIFSVRRRTAWG